jgi:hypothetical protein
MTTLLEEVVADLFMLSDQDRAARAVQICGCRQCLISRGKRTYSLSCCHVSF